MKKRVTKLDVQTILAGVSAQVQEEMNSDLKLLLVKMDMAENELVQSLDEKQRILYDKFFEKRKEFNSLAKEIYKKKF